MLLHPNGPDGIDPSSNADGNINVRPIPYKVLFTQVKKEKRSKFYYHTIIIFHPFLLFPIKLLLVTIDISEMKSYCIFLFVEFFFRMKHESSFRPNILYFACSSKKLSFFLLGGDWIIMRTYLLLITSLKG